MITTSSSTNTVIEPTPTNSREAPQLTSSQDHQGPVEGEGSTGSVYVDIRLTDNESEQPIRLRVPPNFDPIAYATEYIQLHTAAQTTTLLPTQSLELQTQSVGRSQVTDEASNTDQNKDIPSVLPN